MTNTNISHFLNKYHLKIFSNLTLKRKTSTSSIEDRKLEELALLDSANTDTHYRHRNYHYSHLALVLSQYLTINL